jgi:acyl dehydratase
MSETKPSGWTGALNPKPEVGQSAERSLTTTMKHIEDFTAMSGDRNPLHYDEAAAKASIFGRLIVQGGVTTSVLNAVVAEDLPGPGSVFLGVEWKFLKAVGVGETITGRVEILTVRDDKPICTLKTTVLNEKGEACVEGTATTYTAPLKTA